MIFENFVGNRNEKNKVKMNKPLYLGMSILDIRQIPIALLFILKLKISIKTLLMMLKDGLMHLTMMKMMKDHFQ